MGKLTILLNYVTVLYLIWQSVADYIKMLIQVLGYFNTLYMALNHNPLVWHYYSTYRNVGVTGDRAGKPVTADQDVHTCKGNTAFVSTKNWLFWWEVTTSRAVFVGTETGVDIIKPCLLHFMYLFSGEVRARKILKFREGLQS